MRPRPASTLATAVLVAAVAVGCAVDGGPGDEPTVDAAAVNDAMAALADARAAVARQVDAEVRAGVRVEPMAAQLRSPDTVDAGLDEVPATVELFSRVTPEDGGPLLDRLDAAIDDAAAAIGTTMAAAEPESWQADYLAAQAEVLDALAGWADASRAVHEVAVATWPLWQEVTEAAAILDQDRWRYRTEEEAAATWEIEVDDRMAPLTEAHAALTSASEARDAAATAVTDADAAAAAVFEARPTQPTP